MDAVHNCQIINTVLCD